MAIIMDGKALAAKMQDHLHEKVERLKEKEWIVPGLVVIMVGDNPASQVYVRNKERAAKKAGFHSKTVNLSESISEEELIEVIEQYNQDPLFHGILVQLPLPNHINEMRILLAIDPKKDHRQYAHIYDAVCQDHYSVLDRKSTRLNSSHLV